MIQGNPHKRMLKTETTGEGEDRVTVKLNEIRPSDLTYDNTQTLQIVNDEVVVVPRPPRPVVVPDKVDTWKLRAVVEAAGQKAYVEGFIALLPEAHRIPISNGWENAAVIHRDNQFLAIVIANEDNNIDTETVDAWFLATKQFD